MNSVAFIRAVAQARADRVEAVLASIGPCALHCLGRRAA